MPDPVTGTSSAGLTSETTEAPQGTAGVTLSQASALVTAVTRIHYDLGDIRPDGCLTFPGVAPNNDGSTINLPADAGVLVGYRVAGFGVVQESEVVDVAESEGQLVVTITASGFTEITAGTYYFFPVGNGATLDLETLVPAYTPEGGRDLVLTGRISPALWQYATTPTIFIAPPTPTSAGNNLIMLSLEVLAESYSKAINGELNLVFSDESYSVTLQRGNTSPDFSQKATAIFRPTANSYEKLVFVGPLLLPETSFFGVNASSAAVGATAYTAATPTSVWKLSSKTLMAA